MCSTPLTHAPLGQAVSYPTNYDPAHLFPIARSINRAALKIVRPWFGADLWQAYELSWLNLKGKPLVAVGRFEFDQNSTHLVESKSLKLYLNSLNETRFESIETVRETIRRDLSQAAGMAVNVTLWHPDEADSLAQRPLAGSCIDALDIEISRYEPAPDLLHCVSGTELVNETLVSHLLKSNCPVTGQPDWGSVQIQYTGRAIDRASLLRYIVSLRRHTEFHEHCVEKMFCDLMQACEPEHLTVLACYTRRGGLDINPWRSTENKAPDIPRTLRQ